MGGEDPRFGSRAVGHPAPRLPGSVATMSKLVRGRDLEYVAVMVVDEIESAPGVEHLPLNRACD